VREGDLFVALQGENFDGHQFVKNVVGLGVKGVMVEATRGKRALSAVKKASNRSNENFPFVVGVGDTTRAYQDIASFHRQRFQIPVVAITGSNGKTTTKEMVASVLRERWTILKTEGNFNNRLGVPHTLLRLTKRHQVAVVELGVDAEGQTTRLCEIAKPTLGVITNIGPDHLEFFGSLEGSARAKAELLACLPPDGAIVLNADDHFYKFLKRQVRSQEISFGLSRRSHVWASHVHVKGADTVCRVHLRGRKQSHRVSVKVQGHHNVANAMAAVAVGRMLGISMKHIAAGLGKFRPAAMRSQIKSIHGLTIIEDCYNANPASMKAAITLLKELGHGKPTIAVVGDMLELGKGARAMHRDMGAFIADQSVSSLIVCGDLGKEIARGAKTRGMENSAIFQVPRASEATVCLQAIANPGDVVLLKASRGMQLEKVLDGFSMKKNFPKNLNHRKHD
jgi:UDP-N-acetylmuramoyl-tripeptide--D-alanyl-D-alanine ligase